MMEKDALIRLHAIQKKYQRDSEELVILDKITIEIPEGDFVALMGPSGSGKSTLLHLIAGIDKPTSGQVWVASEELNVLTETELAQWRGQNIGFIFQFYHLIPVLTALENVELPLLLTPLSKQERRRQAITALEIVGLGERLHHYPKQLSGGQEQRVAIARAIATDPLVMVADEPTGDLDAKSANEILTLLQRLNQEFNKTIVMVTHDSHAASYAKRTLHLEKGILKSENVTRQEKSF